MATTRQAHTVWEGTLFEGAGTVTFDSSDMGDQAVTWASRAEDPNGRTSPEELIAAAHSSCYAMQLSALIAAAGGTPQSLDVRADVTLGPDPNGGFAITGIKLTVRGEVEGLDAAGFEKAAQAAKEGCPVSKALTGTTITLDVGLE
jgi:osmotically inducible protein OsmC